jgi:pimeloyl-ACP methyl ester carboxylesterase
VETHAADAAALIEALGLGRPIVVGSSGGARIAVELARSRPELLSGAVFSEPPIFSRVPDAGKAFMAEIAAAVRPAAERDGPRAAVDTFFPLVCPGLWSTLEEDKKDRYRANGRMMLAEFCGTGIPTEYGRRRSDQAARTGARRHRKPPCTACLRNSAGASVARCAVRRIGRLRPCDIRGETRRLCKSRRRLGD